MNDNNNDSNSKSELFALNNSDVPFTLEESLQRAEERQRRRTLRKGIVVSALSLTAIGVTALIFNSTEFSQQSSLHEVPSTKFSQHSSLHEVPSTKFSQQSSLHEVPSTKSSQRSSLHEVPSTKSSQRSSLKGVLIATADVIRSLDLDPKAYGEISAMLGTSDRVVMVENTANKESCIQISCSGGESHTITCSLPAPLPFRVTKLDGTLLYDIERVNNQHHTSAVVPIRMKLDDSEVLLWYDAEPALTQTLTNHNINDAHAFDDGVTTSLRPDHSVNFRLHTSPSEIKAINVHNLTGSKVGSSRVVWQRIDASTIEVAISDMHRGVFEIVANAKNRHILMIR